MATANPFDKDEARLYMPVDVMIGGEDQARTCFFHLRMVARALKQAGVVELDEPIDTLKELEILVDGEAERAYMLQIFLKDSAGLYKEPKAGPFFYEIIQRKGDQGFGGGNFRALFESIERQQQAEGKSA